MKEKEEPKQVNIGGVEKKELAEQKTMKFVALQI